jgi:hypothetical protein
MKKVFEFLYGDKTACLWTMIGGFALIMLSVGFANKLMLIGWALSFSAVLVHGYYTIAEWIHAYKARKRDYQGDTSK